MRLLLIALALFSLFASLSCLPAPDEAARDQVEQTGEAQPPATPEETEKPGTALQLMPAHVVKVTDGDTVRVLLEGGSEEAVRLIGVDTPESTRKVEPFGKEAAAFTRKRLGGKKIYLEFDVAERDRFGRLLAYAWLSPPKSDCETAVRAYMFNADLLLHGFAQVMTIAPNVKYADLFIQLQREARDAQKGLWGAEPEAPQSLEAGYIGNARTLKFHRPDCRWAKEISPANRVEIDSRNEAISAGYDPCGVCRP